MRAPPFPDRLLGMDIRTKEGELPHNTDQDTVRLFIK